MKYRSFSLFRQPGFKVVLIGLILIAGFFLFNYFVPTIEATIDGFTEGASEDNCATRDPSDDSSGICIKCNDNYTLIDGECMLESPVEQTQ